MSALSAQTMTGLLTQPYGRGGETLELQLGTDAGGFTLVPAYTFREYKVRYQIDPPAPQYVLYTKVPIPTSGLQVEVHYQFAGADNSSVLTLPGGSFAGSSFAIPIPAGADASLRITRFRQLPVPIAGAGMSNFGIVALLGNIAKLTWVVGGEKDLIRGTLRDVQLQRHVSFAHDASLDALGTDLRVPRFPPRQYSFDPDTIALYHLDGSVPAAGAVLDDTTRFGLPGHPGVNLAALTNLTAKFGTGFSFGPTGAIEIPNQSDFDLPAASSFTFEAFFRADVVSDSDPALIAGKATLTNAGALSTPGWALTFGSFRGFANNIRWSISDGATTIDLFADADFGDGQFHHIAGILDRATQQSRLVVDGKISATLGTAALGALTNAVAIRIGQSTTAQQQFSGVVDEVRISRIARTDFDPVLGESDDNYRERLEIFRRWQVPDPVDLLQTINSKVQINGDPNSFVRIETTKPAATASATVRIVPPKLVAGQSIAADGSLLAKEANVSGLASDDSTFQEMLLLHHDNANVAYGADDNNHRMQSVTANALDRLIALLAAAIPAIAGNLVINKSYDPTDSGLHGVGRALRLGHATLAPEQLAVFAHRANFDFVSNTGTGIYVSVAAGESLRIVIEPRVAAELPPDGSDAFSGHVFDVHVAQSSLPVAGLFRWILIPWGSGRASLEPHPSDPATMRTPVENRPHVQISADAPGELTLRVEYTLARTTFTGTLDLNFTVATLPDNSSITAEGSTADLEVTVIGAPTGTLNPIYLVKSALPINFGVAPNNKLMQIVVETPLQRLVSLLAANAATLQVLKSFDPADTGFFKLGRAIRITHPTFDIGSLGALAHQSGFDFVSRQGTQIYCSVGEGEKIQIAKAADLTPINRELVSGVPVALQARFTSLPPRPAPPAPALDSYNWNTVSIGNGGGNFDFILRPTVQFTPRETGLLELNLTYLEADPNSVNPYTFEIRLNNTLNVPATIIPKGQYDLLMNILNYFHPIGIEVVTTQIRQHVVEVRENLLNAFPGYTFPDFRV